MSDALGKGFDYPLGSSQAARHVFSLVAASLIYGGQTASQLPINLPDQRLRPIAACDAGRYGQDKFMSGRGQMGKGAVRRRLSAVGFSAVVLIGLVAVDSPSWGAGSTSGHRGSVGTAPPQYQWPKFALAPGDNGVSADPAISTQNAAQLGVRWMAPTQGPALTSPVVAYSSGLGRTVVYQGNEGGYLNAFDAGSGQ
ncbi:MAG TPA: hypothetical protein VKI19_15070, partial [Acidimicrobiales bacterium]|nr:hypothetical protein [Acidimicrobiales bacterium]